jgi:hypothetical protein
MAAVAAKAAAARADKDVNFYKIIKFDLNNAN